MNAIATIINFTFTAVRWASARRPVSHAAAAVFVITSNMVAHEGLMAWLPGKLGWALTALFGAVSVLQWLGLGRQDACLDAKDHARADAVIHQAWIFGAIETVLFAAGVLAIAAADGLAVYDWLPVTAALLGAALFAFVNFKVKWVSCDAVSRRTPVAGSAHHALFSEPLPVVPALPEPITETARYTSDAGVVDFMAMLEKRESAMGSDPRIQANADRDASERFRLWKRREQRRRQRGAIAA